jgi:hypothetical protein
VSGTPAEAAEFAEPAEAGAVAPEAELQEADEDLRDRAAAAIAAAQDGAKHLLELAAAEARLAALSGVSMLLMIILAAGLSIVGWGFVAGVAAYLLVLLGLPWPAAGLVMAGAHAIAAYLLWRGVVKLSRNLTLPALRRTVTGTNGE